MRLDRLQRKTYQYLFEISGQHIPYGYAYRRFPFDKTNNVTRLYGYGETWDDNYGYMIYFDSIKFYI